MVGQLELCGDVDVNGSALLKFLRKVIRQEDTNHPTLEPQTAVLATSNSEEEIPRYPPFMKGLPVTHPDKLIETQCELIGQIREAGLASKEIFEQYYLESLRRFASYAHLLPASQTHHHRGAGGLLRHATEVALWSLQSGDRVLLPGDQTPRRRRELEPRWQLAVFLAALCHDVGKPVTDLVVTSRDGEKVWNPFIEDLYSWAVRNEVDRYFLHWRENRGKNHTAISSLLVERIVSPKGLAWIAEGETDLVLWMMEAINGQPSQENMIHDLVIRSDQVSVEKDLRSLGEAFAGYELGVPVERFLIDIMRRLVREGNWCINEPGARLWHIEGHLYLVWPSGGEEIAAIINQEKLPGLPRTPSSILDMLVERKLADSREKQNDGNRCWLIAPALLSEKIPNIRLSAIRLRDPALIIDPPPPSVAGKLVGEDDPAAKTSTDVPSAIKVAKELLAPVEVPEPEAIAPEAPVASALPYDQFDGPVGEALKVLADDIRTGKKARDKLIHIDAVGILCIKWPDAFKGYGLENKIILDELARRNWLVVDPLAPFRKVAEVAVGIGAPWKVIRLQPAVKELMDVEMDQKSDAGSSTKGKGPRGKAPVASTEKADSPAEDGSVVEERQARKLALIEQVVTILRQTVTEGALVAQQEGEFLWIKVKDADPVLKAKIKMTRGQIFALNGIVPDQFASVDRDRLLYFRIRA